ncbi:hypothetical protein [Streptomyces sp. NPDC005322]|uniref:hypothetical protein n=1 Tax=unclassified Streptomyces TaxID=2593676 RepID=UPI0033AFFADB
MRIAKKAAFLTAAAATAVLVGAGGAAAYGGNGLGGFGGFVHQTNTCDARTGDNTQVGADGPTGDINITPACTNFISG